jgi:hypothetical protein
MCWTPATSPTSGQRPPTTTSCWPRSGTRRCARCWPAHLLPSCQDLLALLAADPPVPCAQISARLGIPVGSIGPSRSHFLDKLRYHPAIATLIDAEPARETNEPLQQAVMP